MDETTFQQELSKLKKRVSHMAASYQQRSPPRDVTFPSGGDAFGDQLKDIKASLLHMQESLNGLSEAQKRPAMPREMGNFMEECAMTGTHGGFRSYPFGLPTSSLVSTPHGAWNTEAYYQNRAQNYSSVPEGVQGRTNGYLAAQNPECFPGATNVPHIPAKLKLALPSAPLFWQLYEGLRKDVTGLDSLVEDLEQSVDELEVRVDRVDPRYTPSGSDFDASGTVGANVSSRFPGRFDGSLTGCYVPGHVSQKPSELDTGSTLRWEQSTAGPSHDTQPATSIETTGTGEIKAYEGVAFRDKEIARLEELMRGNQEDLQKGEEISRKKDAEIEQLRSDNGQLRARIDELEFSLSDREGSLSAYSDMLADKQSEIDNLRSECSSQSQQLSAWDVRYYHVKQSYLRKKTQLVNADLEVQQLQHALHQKQEDLEDALHSKDDEIFRLREFCDSKDAIVRQQEDIISRGARLIEDRDDELERTTRELKILRDDFENECRERERFARLFEERGEVVAQLRTSLDEAYEHAHVTVPGSESVHYNGPEAPEAHAEPTSPTRARPSTPIPYRPLSFATVGKEPRVVSSKWSPQPIRNNVRTFSEQQRASLWETGPSSAQRQFGVSGYSGQEDRTPDGHKRDLRRSDSVRLLRRLALTEEGTAKQPTQQMTEREHESGRQHPPRSKRVLPLDDIIRQPLPAPTALPPLPPRRHGSHADLGNRTQRHSQPSQDDERVISKHMSMQELNAPRRRLHAYVEEGVEGEGSGERRSDV